jgi:endonuclease III
LLYLVARPSWPCLNGTFMKDSKEYSKKIQKLYRSLKQKPGKHAPVEFDEPVDALVFAIVSENLTESQAHASMKKLKDYFVDWNDLRVATVEEIAEVLGQDVEPARNIAATLVGALKAVFEKHNMLSLQSLRKLGKRPAKILLEKLNGATPFVVDYCMLTSMQGHAIPLTPKMIEYLKASQLIHAEAAYEEIEGFLCRLISIKNAYEFYSLLRHESESPKTRTRKTKQAKKT